MDCDTTGVEPDFALVKFKKLSGGGYFKIINQSLPPALRKLGRKVEVKRVDLRPQAVEITAQEILTKDRVSVRVTLDCSAIIGSKGPGG